MDEILTYVSMYGVFSISFLRYGSSNSALVFFNLSESLQTHFRHFPLRWAYFIVKVKKFPIFYVQCIPGASSFYLNHNMLQESKEKYIEVLYQNKAKLRSLYTFSHNLVLWLSAFQDK